MRWMSCFLLLVLVLASAACGDDSNRESSSSDTGSAESAEDLPTGIDTDEIASRAQRVLDELTVEEDAEVIDQPAEEALFESENTADSAEIEATATYLDATVSHADTIWSNWFRANGFTEPGVGVYVLRPDDTFTTTCGGETVDGGYNNAFYCPSDPNSTGLGPTGQDTGAIVLPVETLRQMWLGDIFDQQVSSVQRVGDFAAGIITAHEFGHHISDEMGQQTGVAQPGKPNSELIADCFAGVWAYSVFLDNYLEEGDIDEAVNALGVIGDDVGDHGTNAERQTAFLIGYTGTQVAPGGGMPQRCIEEFWR